MGHHELGETLLAPGSVEDLPEKAFPLKINPRRRFVQQQDLGLTGQGRSQQDTAQFPAGKIAHAPPDEMLRMHGRQGRAGTPGGTALDAEPEGTALMPQREEFGHGQGQGAVHLQVLRHIGQAGSPAAAPLHADLAGIGDLVDDAVQQGAFPCAVGADQSVNRTGGDAEGGVIQGGEAVKGLDDVFHFDHCSYTSSMSAAASASVTPRYRSSFSSFFTSARSVSRRTASASAVPLTKLPFPATE